MFMQPFLPKKGDLFFQRKCTAAERGNKVAVGGFFEILRGKPYSAYKLVDAYTEFFGQRRQHFHVGHVVAVLPAGNGLVGHAELFSELLLRQAFLFPQGGYKFSDFDLIHFYIPPKNSIAQFWQKFFPINSECAARKRQNVFLL